MDIKDFGAGVQRLIAGHDLDAATAHAMFCAVLNNTQPDLHQGAFLAALASKGETGDELHAAWRAIDEIDTRHVIPAVTEPLCENSGTGMDGLNTINVSTAAALVAAAGGVRMARHGARALSSQFGTVDMAESLGIDVECDVATVARSIEEAGIGLFNGMSPQVHPAALGRILSQIRFGSTLNIAASLAHPARPTLALRGVYHPGVCERVARLMQAIGYRRALIVCGSDAESGRSMDEISPCGSTQVCELADGQLSHYRIEPEAFGISRHPLAAVLRHGLPDEEHARFLALLDGHGEAALVDFVSLNAGAILWLAGKAPGLCEGVAQAKSILASGAALARLSLWRGCQQQTTHA